MIKLKGVFRKPDIFPSINFEAWLKRRHPEISLSHGDEFRVSVSRKVGKNRKLKNETVRIEGCDSPDGSLFYVAHFN